MELGFIYTMIFIAKDTSLKISNIEKDFYSYINKARLSKKQKFVKDSKDYSNKKRVNY